MTHSELVESLAEYWRTKPKESNVVITELTLGPSWSAREHPGIADVYVRSVSWTKPRVRICEVKATRSDYNSDVKSGKYLKYVRHCHQLFFASEQGLITAGELPDRVGLLEFNPDKGWAVKRRALVNPCDPDPKVTLAALFNRHERLHPVEARAARMAKLSADLKTEGARLHRAMLGKYGLELTRMEIELQSKDLEMKRAKKTLREVSRLLGIDENANYYQVTDALREVLDHLGQSGTADRHNQRLRSILTSLDHVRREVENMVITNQGG